MKLWLARVCIGAVLAFNLQCAVVFLVWPDHFAPAYELSGTAGAAAVRGIGVLFLMWNVPYVVAVWHPQHQRAAVWQAVAMQTIGVLGEAGIRAGLPETNAVLSAAIARFIIFDAAGLAFLVVALALAAPPRPDQSNTASTNNLHAW